MPVPGEFEQLFEVAAPGHGTRPVATLYWSVRADNASSVTPAAAAASSSSRRSSARAKFPRSDWRSARTGILYSRRVPLEGSMTYGIDPFSIQFRIVRGETRRRSAASFVVMRRGLVRGTVDIGISMGSVEDSTVLSADSVISLHTLTGGKRNTFRIGRYVAGVCVVLRVAYLKERISSTLPSLPRRALPLAAHCWPSEKRDPAEVIKARTASRTSDGSGRYWARTSDPQLVELVLSQLS